jgi:hypothetical protein
MQATAGNGEPVLEIAWLNDRSGAVKVTLDYETYFDREKGTPIEKIVIVREGETNIRDIRDKPPVHLEAPEGGTSLCATSGANFGVISDATCISCLRLRASC